MNNKKAVSAVVATVLIILITVAAVTIIWTAVIPMIRKTTQGGTLCFDAQAGVSLSSQGGYTCVYNDTLTTWAVKFQISRGNEDFTLSDIKVGVGSAGNTLSKSLVTDGKDSTGVQMTLAGLPGVNSEKVYLLTGLASKPDKIEIAPAVKTGATDKTCPVSSTVSPLNLCQ